MTVSDAGSSAAPSPARLAPRSLTTTLAPSDSEAARDVAPDTRARPRSPPPPSVKQTHLGSFLPCCDHCCAAITVCDIGASPARPVWCLTHGLVRRGSFASEPGPFSEPGSVSPWRASSTGSMRTRPPSTSSIAAPPPTRVRSRQPVHATAGPLRRRWPVPGPPAARPRARRSRSRGSRPEPRTRCRRSRAPGPGTARRR